MQILLLILLGLAILLLMISFFQRDPYKDLKEEVEQLTLQQVQEIYLIKKKLKILEEELLVSGDDLQLQTSLPAGTKNKREVHDIIKNQIRSLSLQGKTAEQISALSSLNLDEVVSILENQTGRGTRYE